MAGAIKGTKLIFVLAIMTCFFSVAVRYPSTFLSVQFLDGRIEVPETNQSLDAIGATTTTPITSTRSLSLHPYSNATTTITSNVATTETKTTLIDVCFVTSIFGESEDDIDRPGDFTNFALDPWVMGSSSLSYVYYHHVRKRKRTSFRFFLFTNLNELDALGWTKIIKTDDDLPYRRYITRSRWGKFMGWKEPELGPCQIIFYFDGHFEPDPAQWKRFMDMADKIRRSPHGLAQVSHPKLKTPLQEFDSILSSNKDIPRNVEASVRWLQSQSDFRNNCTLYANFYFGYDPKNEHFQRASEFFWDRYSQELDSWRDQPLWCYTLEHFHIRPIHHDPIFRKNIERTGHNNHQYNETADSNAVVVVMPQRHPSNDDR